MIAVSVFSLHLFISYGLGKICFNLINWFLPGTFVFSFIRYRKSFQPPSHKWKNRMEEAIQLEFVRKYLLKTRRLKTLEVLETNWRPQKRINLSFSIQSAPNRTKLDSESKNVKEERKELTKKDLKKKCKHILISSSRHIILYTRS